jgi:threonine/homoserine efflux transporter RhtA
MRTTSTRSGLAVVAAGMVTALVVWAVIRLFGVQLTLKAGSGMSQVDAVDVLLASLVAGLAAWGVYALLARWRRTRCGRSSAAPRSPSPSSGRATWPTASPPPA